MQGVSRWVRDTNLIPLTIVIGLAVFVAMFVESLQFSHLVDFARVFIEIHHNMIRPESRREAIYALLIILVSAVIVTSSVVWWWSTRKLPCYLVDFTVFEAPEEMRATHALFLNESRRSGYFTEDSLQFQERLSRVSGLGDYTACPPGIVNIITHGYPNLTMEAARHEAEWVMFDCVEKLLARTGYSARQIDILIVNCSLFCPTPSLSAMIINKFKMRSDIKSFNLGGMGCSAGMISIDLARDLLAVHKNSVAIVVSTENITQNWYHGNVRSMMVPNTLFRCGAAAILLSNKSSDARRSKYRMHCTVRVHKGANDASFTSVYQTEDSEGNHGVHLVRASALMRVASEALKTNMTVLGPLVLPWDEKLMFVINLVKQKLGTKTEAYIPDFKKAFDHFCIHAGGRAIIDGMAQNLKLSPWHTEPSRATLYRHGNTSSSSVWYELAYIERTNRLKKGHRVWQIAIGSGFKCNSAVWTCIRPPTAENCS